MSAIRLARAATGRDEAAEVRRRLPRPRRRPARRGRLRPGDRRASRPAPACTAAATRRHDRRALERRRGGRRAPCAEHEFAAILAEPYPGQHGPRPARTTGFLELPARAAPTPTARCWSSTRSSPASASPAAARRSCAGVTPDLTVSARSSAAGCPRPPTAGSRELMERIAPAGDVYQAGTLSGNPLAVAAGLATLRAARRAGLRRAWTPRPTRSAAGSRDAGGRPAGAGRPRHGPAHGLLLRRARPRLRRRPAPATPTPTAPGAAALLARGVYPPPSQFEAWFPSLAHTDEHVERTARGRGGRVRRVCPDGGPPARSTQSSRREGGLLADALLDERRRPRLRGARRARRRRAARRRPIATASPSSSRRSTRATSCTTARSRPARTSPTPTSRCWPATASTRSASTRLAGLGDLEAVAELADVISLCAQAQAPRATPGELTPLRRRRGCDRASSRR